MIYRLVTYPIRIKSLTDVELNEQLIVKITSILLQALLVCFYYVSCNKYTLTKMSLVALLLDVFFFLLEYCPVLLCVLQSNHNF